MSTTSLAWLRGMGAGEWVSRLDRGARNIAAPGYVAKGILYLLLGVFLVEASLRRGEELEGAMGAIRIVNSQPLGKVVVAVLLFGLALYACWQLARATLDPEKRARGAAGIVFRAVTLAVGSVYGIFVWKAVGVLGEEIPTEESGSVIEWLGTTLQTPIYRLGVIAIGVCVTLFGAAQIVRALRGGSGSGAAHPWLNRFGYVTRGMISAMLGWFIARGALTYAPTDFRTLREVLIHVREQPFGRGLLLGLAVGLIAYGLLQLARGRSWFRYGSG